MRTSTFLLPLAVVLLVGCQTLGDARKAKGTGTSRVFAASSERAWDVLPNAVNEVDLTIAGMYPDDGYMLAERGTSMFSWGERVAISVDALSAAQTDVEVVSMRAVAVNITAAEFGNKVLDMIQQMLALR